MDIRSVVAEALASTATSLHRGGLGATSGLGALARWVAATPEDGEQDFAEEEAAALGRGDYGYAIALAAAGYGTRTTDRPITRSASGRGIARLEAVYAARRPIVRRCKVVPDALFTTGSTTG